MRAERVAGIEIGFWLGRRNGAARLIELKPPALLTAGQEQRFGVSLRAACYSRPSAAHGTRSGFRHAVTPADAGANADDALSGNIASPDSSD
jgi:hypothetical protein